MKRWFFSTGLMVRGNHLLRLYSYYSLLLALLLMVITGLDRDTVFVGNVRPLLMLSAATAYVIAAALFAAIASRNPDPQAATGYVFVEIALLSAMMLASGGLGSGFSSLLLIPLVISNLLAPGVLGYGVAAWTTLAIFYTEFLRNDVSDPQTLVSAGSYGFLCFALAWVTQSLSRRLNSALSLASEQATRLRRLQRLSQQALMDMPDGIIACDQQHRILFFNQRARQWFNLFEGQLLPAPLRIGQEQEMLDTGNEQLLLRRVTLSGSEAGDYLLEIEDSSRVAAEAQQFKLASLGRLTASIAHEIRNPLSALRQAAQLLAETPYLQTDERQLTHIIEQHCLRINRTIEDILQLSRRSRSSSESLRLTPWLEHFAQQFRDQHAGEFFSLNYHCPNDILIMFDADHLQQILHNLCSNGLRYARRHAGDQASLTLTVQTISPQRVQLDIIDNGGGVNEEHSRHLFEPFYTTEHNGTGLGLYLCRELCEANQARIQYHSITDGACFRLLLSTPQAISGSGHSA